MSCSPGSSSRLPSWHSWPLSVSSLEGLGGGQVRVARFWPREPLGGGLVTLDHVGWLGRTKISPEVDPPYSTLLFLQELWRQRMPPFWAS